MAGRAVRVRPEGTAGAWRWAVALRVFQPGLPATAVALGMPGPGRRTRGTGSPGRVSVAEVTVGAIAALRL